MSPETRDQPSLEEIEVKQIKIESPEEIGKVLKSVKKEDGEMEKRDSGALKEFRTTEG